MYSTRSLYSIPTCTELVLHKCTFDFLFHLSGCIEALSAESTSSHGVSMASLAAPSQNTSGGGAGAGGTGPGAGGSASVGASPARSSDNNAADAKGSSGSASASGSGGPFFSRFTQSLRHHIGAVASTIEREARDLRSRFQGSPKKHPPPAADASHDATAASDATSTPAASSQSPASVCSYHIRIRC